VQTRHLLRYSAVSRVKLCGMSADMEMNDQPRAAAAERPAYVAPTLTFVGLLTEIVQSGQGKMSTNGPDGPDPRKPPGI
jgi:hypothetical protein